MTLFQHHSKASLEGFTRWLHSKRPSIIQVRLPNKLQARPASPRKAFYLATFLSIYNKRLLRQKTGGACLYMPQYGHWLGSFEVIPPPPPSPKKLVFPPPKNENSPLKTVVSDPKF